jgi:hypothetical protein
MEMKHKAIRIGILAVALVFCAVGMGAISSPTASVRICRTNADCPGHFVCCQSGFCCRQ